MEHIFGVRYPKSYRTKGYYRLPESTIWHGFYLNESNFILGREIKLLVGKKHVNKKQKPLNPNNFRPDYARQ